MTKPRKDLSADALVGSIRKSFAKIKDWRLKTKIPITDCMMSSYAVFSLKYPSLLSFEKAAKLEEPASGNLHTLFGIRNVPCDTYLREVVDEIDLNTFRPVFKDLFHKVQKG